MSWQAEKEQLGREIARRLYQDGMFQTVFKPGKEQGWELKSGIWSPYYINLRLLGTQPGLLTRIGTAMARMRAAEMGDCNKLLGVEMAGIPLAVATSLASNELGQPLPFLYTRPLHPKPRTAEEARKMLGNQSVAWGEHRFVEGAVEPGDRIAIWDDMATNLASKLIAKALLDSEVSKRGLAGVDCRWVGVLLDRDQGAQQQAQEHGLSLHALIAFPHLLEWLEAEMRPEEHRLLRAYHRKPSAFQDVNDREAWLR